MRSVGVTAKILAITPALMPASRLRRGSKFLSLIFERILGRVEGEEADAVFGDRADNQCGASFVCYRARAPSLRNTWLTTKNGFRAELAGFPSLRS
jgi:hypothetical protein